MMTEEQIKEAAAAYEAKLRAWAKSQEGQEDGYEYERSFVEFIRKAAQDALQRSLGEVSESKNKKKE